MASAFGAVTMRADSTESTQSTASDCGMITSEVSATAGFAATANSRSGNHNVSPYPATASASPIFARRSLGPNVIFTKTIESGGAVIRTTVTPVAGNCDPGSNTRRPPLATTLAANSRERTDSSSGARSGTPGKRTTALAS